MPPQEPQHHENGRAQSNRDRTRAVRKYRKRRRIEENGGKSVRKRASAKIVCDRDGEQFWEVAKVVGRRTRKGRVEYLIRWKGLSESENTWEPASNLCDTAMNEAVRFTKSLKDLHQKSEENERLLLSVNAKLEPTTSHSDNGRHVAIEDHTWYWTDEEQLRYRTIERIDVNQEDAPSQVNEARLNGTPVVLVGHTGWANFAKSWLIPKNPNDKPKQEGFLVSTDADNDSDELLDLSRQHDLDLEQMIEDIGLEEVPVIRRDYNEENPIQASVLASKFLSTYWPSEQTTLNSTPSRRKPLLYLHQWQFPLSDTAGRKLCHKNEPLPKNILGEDLLQYWLDLPQCKGDNPLQYLFMGREETMSRLHRDCGGLEILIAPIVGEKECVLVHRSDGGPCFYHLKASLDSIDLHSFPLMAHARIWRSVIRPGEILLMPQGTYHQCRNVTPCLSYSRFHLDTVNLPAFLQSMADYDAPEIEHDEVLWNCTTELIRRVDAFSDESRKHYKKSPSTEPLPLSKRTISSVNILRSLRHACREVARRIEVQRFVKKNWSARKGPGCKVMDCARLEGDGTQSLGNQAITESKADTAATPTDLHDWDLMVDDIDTCLHEFRHRNRAKIPPLILKRPKNNSELRCFDADSIQAPENEDNCASVIKSVCDDSLPGHCNDLASTFRMLPNCPSSLRRTVFLDEIGIDDILVMSFNGKQVKGRVLEVVEQMDAAFLSYEDYPVEYNDFQPFERLRESHAGGSGAEILPEQVKPGALVVNKWGALGEEYRAVVEFTTSQAFVSASLLGVGCERWIPFEHIFYKVPNQDQNGG